MRLARFLRLLTCAAVLSTAAVDHLWAQEDTPVSRGRLLARIHCAMCHAIDRHGNSPSSIAPPFRMLHERYPVEYLQEALAEGIVAGHPSMPQFMFRPEQIADFIAYLKSLEG